jgi:hypothetical protein
MTISSNGAFVVSCDFRIRFSAQHFISSHFFFTSLRHHFEDQNPGGKIERVYPPMGPQGRIHVLTGKQLPARAQSAHPSHGIRWIHPFVNSDKPQSVDPVQWVDHPHSAKEWRDTESFGCREMFKTEAKAPNVSLINWTERPKTALPKTKTSDRRSQNFHIISNQTVPLEPPTSSFGCKHLFKTDDRADQADPLVWVHTATQQLHLRVRVCFS